MPLVIADAHAEGFKQALGSFASGVTVVTFWDRDDRPSGMTASSFSSVSIDPLLVLVCMNREARSYEDVMSRSRFGVNILGQSGVDISSHCARPGKDKLLPAEWLHDVSLDHSPPALVEAIAYLDCSLESEVPAGTHSILVGEVQGIGLSEDHIEASPLLYYRGNYRELKAIEQVHA